PYSAGDSTHSPLRFADTTGVLITASSQRPRPGAVKATATTRNAQMPRVMSEPFSVATAPGARQWPTAASPDPPAGRPGRRGHGGAGTPARGGAAGDPARVARRPAPGPDAARSSAAGGGPLLRARPLRPRPRRFVFFLRLPVGPAGQDQGDLFAQLSHRELHA